MEKAPKRKDPKDNAWLTRFVILFFMIINIHLLPVATTYNKNKRIVALLQVYHWIARWHGAHLQILCAPGRDSG